MSPLQTAVWGEGACCERGALGIPGTSSHQAPPSHMATTTETGEMESGPQVCPLSAEKCPTWDFPGGPVFKTLQGT